MFVFLLCMGLSQQIRAAHRVRQSMLAQTKVVLQKKKNQAVEIHEENTGP